MSGTPSSGTVYGIGVGPGDPELLTLKALRILRAAPVIAYPAPDAGDSFARTIAAPHLPGGQQEIAIRMPLGDGQLPEGRDLRRRGRAIAAHVAAGRDVAVLCEGDPFFYGSFMYLYARLAGRCPVTVVPGVSSLMACADAAGAPLAARNDVLTVIPAPLPERRARARGSPNAEAAAIMKLGRHLGTLRRVLTACARLDRAHPLCRARDACRTSACCRCAEVGDETAPYFSMMLVHKRGEAWP